MNARLSAMALPRRAYRLIDRTTLNWRRPFVAVLASNTKTRAQLNRYYNLLTSGAKQRFQRRYGALFKDRALAPGTWMVEFAGRAVRMPLRREHAWLDWALALSVLGHDDEIKDTYAALVQSDQRPAVFIDIGANYGTHSVLLLAAGVPTFSFEPNAACLEQFRTMCDLNGLEGRWEQVALGDRDGEVELTYLEEGTSLGSVSAAAEALKGSPGARSQIVPLRRLDDYQREFPPGPMLIKIDAEGFECEVIKGAEEILSRRSPKIIFESDKPDTKPTLYALFRENGYAIFSLPWRPGRSARPLDAGRFINATAGNFIAIKPE